MIPLWSLQLLALFFASKVSATAVTYHVPMKWYVTHESNDC